MLKINVIHTDVFLTEKVTEIKTNIFVTSFGPVSDTEMVSF